MENVTTFEGKSDMQTREIFTDNLVISWSTSKGRDTYGWNICRLKNVKTKKRYLTMGGGYDMTGTVFGEYLMAEHQGRLLALARSLKAAGHPAIDSNAAPNNVRFVGFYGLAYNTVKESVYLDGGCGFESMLSLASKLGLHVQVHKAPKGTTLINVSEA